jgi:hypothetical protein
MRRAWPSLFLLSGCVLLLVSLYLPWQEPASGSVIRGLFLTQGGPTAALPNLFSGEGQPSIDGWASRVSPAAALSALLLAVSAAAALVRPSRRAGIPLGQLALVAGYFSVAVAIDTLSLVARLDVPPVTLHLAYGAYLGLAAIGYLVVAAGMRWRSYLDWRPFAGRPAVLLLAAGLLVSFLLPWGREFPDGSNDDGIATPPAAIAAVLALRLLVVAWRGNPAASRERILLPFAVALFTGAAVGIETFGGSHTYGAWLGLGFAVTLLGVVAAGASVPWPTRSEWRELGTRPAWRELGIAATAVVLVSSLFLPWQTECFDKAVDFEFAGRCVSDDNWGTSGTTAAVLAVILVLSILVRRTRGVPIVELAAGIALFVATRGFGLLEDQGGGFRLEFGKGSTIGFAASAAIVALTVWRLRPSRPDWGAVRLAALPILACAGYLAIVVVPFWYVLPRHWQSAIGLAPLSWLTVAGILLVIHLIALWFKRALRDEMSAQPLLVIPLALLALAGVDLVRLRDDGVGWGGGLVLGLCAFLALAGWFEQGEGVRRVRIPEILRIDRL